MSKSKSNTITLKLAQHQIRESAMVQLGINPANFSARNNIGYFMADRKKANKRGYSKHKKHSFDN